MFQRRALDLIVSPEARRAFDLGHEDPRLRDRYGRSTTGQGCLLARRLVEAGVRFVTVNCAGWDHHDSIFRSLDRILPEFDAALSALIEALDARGLLETTLVVAMGEFGHTPKINDKAGRDHWGHAASLVFSVGGVASGRLIGRAIPTILEHEPNNRLARPQLVTGTAEIEGLISPGDDVDVFAVDMEKGETLVAEAIASRPYSRINLYLTILSPDDHELAAIDDLFGHDAATWTIIPDGGRYPVVIKDAERQHHDGGIEPKMTRPYRLDVGRLTLISGSMPAGARRGRTTALRLQGANLPERDLVQFDPSINSPLGNHLLIFADSNPLSLRLDDLAENFEREPNEHPESAPIVMVPAAIDGTFSPPDGEGPDLDHFRLKIIPGLEGDFAITAHAARIGSTCDPVLAVLDGKGATQVEKDGKLGRNAEIERRIDSNEGLLISVRDHSGRGCPRYTYRIEVEPVKPGVLVTAKLGHWTIPRSGTLLVPVLIERKKLEGAITIAAEGLPQGVGSSPIVIFPDKSKGLLAFSATAEALIGPFTPRLIVRKAPATARFVERGPLNEVPREGDQNRGPCETTTESSQPVLAVVKRMDLLVKPTQGPILVAKQSKAEVVFAIEGFDDRSRKLKVRLMAGGKTLDRFDPIGVLDLPATTSAATFVLIHKPNALAVEFEIAAHAWSDGSPEILGLDSPTVIVKIE